LIPSTEKEKKKKGLFWLRVLEVFVHGWLPHYFWTCGKAAEAGDFHQTQ
jgi:hypothetical protein